jgi:integrase/recombinase XerC
MKVVICPDVTLDITSSCLYENIKDLKLDKTVKVNGVGVFDDNVKILPLISDYLSYQAKHQKIAYTSAGTYGRNLVYFLNYIRNRSDYKPDESDEVFLTVPAYVIQEYMTNLARKEGKSSTTARNRDATIRAFIEYLCRRTEDREPLRADNPYSGEYLSTHPHRKPVISCDLDDLFILIESTVSERERIVLQFMYDSGVRRSELPRIMLEDIKKATNFNAQKFVASDSDQPLESDYTPVEIRGSKGRGNQLKHRWTLVSSATLRRIKKYHASPLYKKHARKYKTSSDTPAFFNAEGTAYTPGAVSKLLERVSKRAIKKGLLTRVISPHKLRHGNAYAILQSDDLGKDYLDRLVIVQKNLGHNHLHTTEMYTSIPQDIYNTMCNESGELLTRAEKMKRLVERTQLKINIRTSK